MNPAFQEALAARLQWTSVIVLDGMERSEPALELALQAAYDAVHELASNDVLKHRHYGPRAPLLLLDVPELAEQYNLAYELYAELYHRNYHAGELGGSGPDWLEPAEPIALPYSEWSVEVTGRLALLCSESGLRSEDAIQGQALTLLRSWTEGETPGHAADLVHAAYISEPVEHHPRLAHQDTSQITHIEFQCRDLL
ncbi:hypothetical protein [Pseudomonas violetae]|uniref:Uncharacterized protein n=1 Tax=Pseudomonas violetae TaxID=2915813 RepID=A0ABT0ET63_9PSED|nr:hypothetical protein [Pseudomonas violetae]MCK1788933.1 hypothetical protein [Pseudomonas violetae]